MVKRFNRRQFLTASAAVASSAWLSGYTVPKYREINAANAVEVAKKVSTYPPELLGLRGDHNGSQNFAHSVALRKQSYALTGKTEETYDLIVVGAGISGLAAAYRYLKSKPQAKILILDNHDDFGGHAKRNEFTINGKTLITYGGSESLDRPKNTFSKTAHQFLNDLGVDYTKFHQYFQQDLYSKKWKLNPEGIHFNQAVFGNNVIVNNIPNAKNAREIISQFPMSDLDKRALINLYRHPKDYWHGHSAKQREQLAHHTSYYDFLKNTVKLNDAPMKYLNNISSDYWGHAINAVSVMEAFEHGYPGLSRLKLKSEKDPQEPYIYHFPDGNASIARLVVRQMIPSIAAGHTMEDIVTAKFNYEQLDLPEHNVRIRLNSTALHIENINDGVAVVYLTKDDTNLHQVQAKHAIFAGHSTIAAHIVSGMSDKQKLAMSSSVKVPMIYAKIAVKNAHAWQKMGVSRLYMPSAPYCLAQLDDPVNIGDYHHASDPSEPIVLHLSRIATSTEGETAREMYRNGRKILVTQDYAALEKELFEQMREIYTAVGENFDDVVSGVTFNRWAHGYAYEQVGLFDSDEIAQSTTAQMRQPVGKIYMANTDVAWMPYLQYAVDEGYRAAEEALKG